MKKNITKTISIEICENINDFTKQLNQAKEKLIQSGYEEVTLHPFYQDDGDDEESYNSFHIEVTGSRLETEIEYKDRIEEDKKALLAKITSVPKTLTNVEFSISKEIKHLLSKNKVNPSIQLGIQIQDKCNLLEVIRNKRKKFEEAINTKDESFILSLEKEMNDSYEIEGSLYLRTH